MAQLTHSPSPDILDVGAGTAAQQSARPRRLADHVNGGWIDDPADVKATGATAGTPGTFTPAGSKVPANLADMTGVVASPATLWTVAQRVVLGDASEAYWSGTAWTAGRAPAAVAEGFTSGTSY